MVSDAAPFGADVYVTCPGMAEMTAVVPGKIFVPSHGYTEMSGFVPAQTVPPLTEEFTIVTVSADVAMCTGCVAAAGWNICLDGTGCPR